MRKFLLGPFALVVLLGCAQDPLKQLERDPGVLAVVGRYWISREDFSRSITYAHDGGPAEDLLQSRIWDGLVNDVLVLNDVTEAAGGSVPPMPLGPYSDPKRREDAVRQALQEKLFSKITISDAEVAHAYQESLADYQKGRGVLLRSMLLIGQAQAQEARRLLLSGHSFVDVARLYSAAPDHGAAEYFEDGELPEYLRSVVSGLKPGQPSAPIEAGLGNYQIILIEKRFEHYQVPLEEAAPIIRLRLSDEAQERLQAQYLASLRERFATAIFSDKLPFHYEKETP